MGCLFFCVLAFEAVHAWLFEIDVAFEETMQLANTGRVAHFTERFGFDLPDTLTGHLKLAADLFECSRVAIGEAEAE